MRRRTRLKFLLSNLYTVEMWDKDLVNAPQSESELALVSRSTAKSASLHFFALCSVWGKCSKFGFSKDFWIVGSKFSQSEFFPLALVPSLSFSRSQVVNFLKWKHHYFSENIAIFHSNDNLFTQYLFLNKKKVSFDDFFIKTWQWENESERKK